MVPRQPIGPAVALLLGACSIASGCCCPSGNAPVTAEDVVGTYVLSGCDIKHTLSLESGGAFVSRREQGGGRGSVLEEQGRWSTKQTEYGTWISLTNLAACHESRSDSRTMPVFRRGSMVVIDVEGDDGIEFKKQALEGSAH